ncbi:MAG TPA: flavodoxin domain-containing protein [Clostridia bacterium]|nr:flavodoxin domain-containing protein [Clostridia bacterium]
MILIAYKTNTGTTKDAAEIIKNTLIANAYQVDFLELSEVKSISKYDTIIIGAPINGMHWLAEASEFISKNKTGLKNKRVACFALSYIINDGRKFWKNRVINNFKRNYEEIHPIDTMIFGGKISHPMPAPARFIFGLPKGLPLDYTNNKEIEQWAMGLMD